MEHQTALVALTEEVDTGHSPAGHPDSVDVYTVEEAAHILRISRSSGYALARRYFATDGREGLPVLRVGNCLRVPAWALRELLRTGRVVRLTTVSERNSDGGGREPAAAGSSRAGPGSRRGRRREGAATGRKETVEQLVLIRDE